jgi:ERCC4-type nuclease
LPGIDSNNVNKVTKNVMTVTEVCRMSEEELKKLIGPKNAKEMKNFIDKKVEIIKDSDV